MIIRKIGASEANSDQNTSEAQNASVNISRNSIRRVFISDFFINDNQNANLTQKGLCPEAEKIDDFLLLHKKAQKFYLINVAVLLVIIISYLYLIVYNFFGDFYNLINIIQDGKKDFLIFVIILFLFLNILIFKDWNNLLSSAIYLIFYGTIKITCQLVIIFLIRRVKMALSKANLLK